MQQGSSDNSKWSSDDSQDYHKEIGNTAIETELSLKDFSQGVYYLQVVSKKRIFTHKIIKE